MQATATAALLACAAALLASGVAGAAPTPGGQAGRRLDLVERRSSHLLHARYGRGCGAMGRAARWDRRTPACAAHRLRTSDRDRLVAGPIDAGRRCGRALGRGSG